MTDLTRDDVLGSYDVLAKSFVVQAAAPMKVLAMTVTRATREAIAAAFDDVAALEAEVASLRAKAAAFDKVMTQKVVRYEVQYEGSYVGEWLDCGDTISKEFRDDNRYRLRALIVRPEAL